MTNLLAIPPGAAYRMRRFFSPLPNLNPMAAAVAARTGFTGDSLSGALPPGLYGPDDPALGLPLDAESVGDAGGVSDALSVVPAPEFDSPSLLAAPRAGLAVRAASALAGLPAFQQRPFEGGGSRFGRGLLSGLAGGFSRGTLLDYGNKAQAVSAANQVAQTQADRNNALKLETWKLRLGLAAKGADDWEITPDMAGKYPALAPLVGRPGVKGADVVRMLEAQANRDRANAHDPNVRISDPQVARVLGMNVGDEVPASQHREAWGVAHPKQPVATASPEELQSRADSILSGIASGALDPDITRYGTNRDGLRGMIADGAVKMGLDLATLEQNWAANKKGISTANSPQQLRMRQAANNIPMLLDQMAGPADSNGVRSGGIIHQLGNTGLPWWNMIEQMGKQASGHAGTIKQYNILASKLAMEQAFLMSGGNQPPKELYDTLRHQYAVTDNPENIGQALATVEETARGYQQSVADVGPITRSTPYVPGSGAQNPVTGANLNVGQNPPAGMRVNPFDWSKYRKGGR